MPNPNPEFEDALEGQIADALMAKFRANAELAAYLDGGVDAYEAETLYRQGDVKAPALAVLIDAVEVRPSGSNRQSKLDCVLFLGLITKPVETRIADNWQRARVIKRIRTIIADGAGALFAGPGDTNQLTHALIAFQRLPQPIPLADGKLLLTVLRVEYKTTIASTTEAVIP